MFLTDVRVYKNRMSLESYTKYHKTIKRTYKHEID